jgi:DNA modification methylase
MKVVARSIRSIKPYDKNPRITDAAVDAVAASIKEYGFRQPIVVDTAGVIIVGHARYLAALKLGLTKVPVHVAKGLSPAQVKAYRIADNQTNTLSMWDNDKLAEELLALQSQGYDLDFTGFSSDQLTEILNSQQSEGLSDPDDIPAPPDKALTQTGDSWVLGNHRLLCGDAGLPTDLDRLLDGARIHLVNTDPPYGVRVEPRSNNAIAAGNSSFEKPTKKSKRTHHQSFDVARQGEKHATHRKLRAKDRPLQNDFLPEAQFQQLLDRWFDNLSRVLLPGRGFYIWGGYANIANYPAVLKAKNLYFSQALIWVKEHPVLTRKDFMGNHEWCFYGWKEGAAHRFFGPPNVADVWSVKKVNPQSMVHLTEKPVELAARAIEYSTKPGEHILDLFGGSGSTLIACEQLNRRAYLMEIDALYCDVIVQRWCRFSGKEALCITQDGKKRTYSAQLKEVA